MPQENRKINPETGQPYPTAKEKLDQITSQIEQGIKDVFNSENYKNYLSVMSRFHNYSLNNCMLIYLQNPKATRVASFKAWSEKFERHVVKGEQGIKIIAPTPYKKKVDVQKIDPETKQPLKDKEGNPILEQKEVTMPAFKAVTVFDVSQTQGKPLPQLVNSLNGKVENFEYLKEAIQKSAPVPVEFQKLEENLDGYFSPKEQKIVIREGMSEPQTLCAMVHETAHSMLHNPETTEEKKIRRVEEVEAESVAYAVCKYFGIDTDENSFGYLAAWSKDKEVTELKESLEIINSASSELIDKIEKNYSEIIAERDLTPVESLTNKICSYLQNVDTYNYNEDVPKMVTDALSVGDTKTVEDVLKLTLSQQENYPFNKEINKKNIDTVDIILMEMRDYERFNFTDITYKVGDKAYLQVQRVDDGINYDFSFYRQDNFKLFDGGITDFDVNDAYANMPLYDLAKAIVDDFNMKTDDISIADDSALDAIEKANSLDDKLAEIEARTDEPKEIIPPCPELTQETLNKFGYTDECMYPITKELAVELMQDYCDVYLLHDNGTEAMANDEEDILNHYGYIGVQKDDWEKIYEKYEEKANLKAQENEFLNSSRDGFAIYQLKTDSFNDEIVFMNSQYLASKNIPIDSNRYDFRYSDDLTKIMDTLEKRQPSTEFSKEQVLDQIYEEFNFRKPEGYNSRSVSVSDIIALRQNGELSFNYVESIGFKDVSDFKQPENYLKNAELSVEDDTGMIDGIINNGKKEDVKTEPEKPKKKESVLKKLEAFNEQIKNSPNEKSKKEPEL